MNFQTKKFSFIDFETQGTKHTPKEFAFVNSLGDQITEHYEIILRPKETMKNYWTKINKKLSSRIIIAHNLAFDKAILIKEFPFFQAGAFLDTLGLYRNFFRKKVDDYSLGALLNLFSLRQFVDELALNQHFIPHRALFDSYACAIVFFHVLKSYPDIAFDINELLGHHKLF